MAVHLYVAAAGAGKTAYCLDLARQAASELRMAPRVCVATRLQEESWRRRIAHTGGAMGVRVFPFDILCRDCLTAARRAVVTPDAATLYRLVCSVVRRCPLAHFAAIASRPGFIQETQRLIAELKGALVPPDPFALAVSRFGDPPALRDLAAIYTAYEAALRAENWVDSAGMTGAAIEAAQQETAVGTDWPLLIVDGFDHFEPAKLRLLQQLSGRVGEMIVTLTGELVPRGAAHRRFNRTRRQIEEALAIDAEPLLRCRPSRSSALARLEARLFEPSADPVPDDASVQLIEAADRAGEVRASLRWLKARLRQPGMRPSDLALLARSVLPYRQLVVQTAAEFGLPIRLIETQPLRSSPVIAALVRLVQLSASTHPGEPRPLQHNQLIETWRSPYFDWSALAAEDEAVCMAITSEDADALDAAGRWARVIGGLDQWTEALTRLSLRGDEREEDDDRGVPPGVPVGAEAEALLGKLLRFMRRMTPPAGRRAIVDFVEWMENLIGPDALASSSYDREDDQQDDTSLRVVERVRHGPPDEADRDLAALREFKSVLRGLVSVGEIRDSHALLDFAEFLAELTQIIDASAYRMPVSSAPDVILVADVNEARGVYFRAAAVMGLAEGEFPAVVREDPFLRDATRADLRLEGIPLEPSAESLERECFYSAISRPTDSLLLTRPRLSDEGAVWQASPFWNAVPFIISARPERLHGDHVAAPPDAASWPELMEGLAEYPGFESIKQLVAQTDRWDAVERGAGILRARAGASQDCLHDGYLRQHAVVGAPFDRREWSASRLESYLACPFMYLVQNVLGLEPRNEPVEGFDTRQLGTLYHRIFERLYATASDTTNLAALLDALPGIAGLVLDAAPAHEGFRATAWWDQTRREIVENVRNSVERLHAYCDGAFRPRYFELRFGGPTALTLRDDGEEIRLHGVIDRVDVDPQGNLRVIDYKTGGSSSFTGRAVRDGKRIQAVLYALAARDGLGLGNPTDAFYWHVIEAGPSPFRLADPKEGGPSAAFDHAVRAAWRAVRGARSGAFVPEPPEAGCPTYCAAAAFCWKYRPGSGGG